MSSILSVTNISSRLFDIGDPNIIPSSLNNIDGIRYTYSQKGRTQLVHKGFYYGREKKVHNKVYWRCTQYTTWLRCHGRLHTENGRIVHISSHNHNKTDEGEKQNMRKAKKILAIKLQGETINFLSSLKRKRKTK